MDKISLDQVRLSVEANIILENFTAMIRPDTAPLNLYQDLTQAYCEKIHNGDLLVSIVANNKPRSIVIDGDSWEPIVALNQPSILKAADERYKERFILYVIANTNCIDKLALYEYDEFVRGSAKDYEGNPEGDAQSCISLWAEESY